MAHFAKINENDVVVAIHVVNNSDIQNLPFPESESLGIQFLTNLWGYSNWKQTSYNNNFRVRYAGIGYTYNSQYDAFISPKPYSSWQLNTTLMDWEAPISYPTDGKVYYWDENIQNWVAFDPQPAPMPS